MFFFLSQQFRWLNYYYTRKRLNQEAGFKSTADFASKIKTSKAKTQDTRSKKSYKEVSENTYPTSGRFAEDIDHKAAVDYLHFQTHNRDKIKTSSRKPYAETGDHHHPNQIKTSTTAPKHEYPSARGDSIRSRLQADSPQRDTKRIEIIAESK